MLNLIRRVNRFPLVLCSIMTALVILDLLLIYVATTTYSGPYTDNAYEKGVHFDRKMASWTIDVSVNNSKICSKIINENNFPVTELFVQAKVMRTVSNKFDSILSLTEDSPGIYCTNFIFQGDGKWQIRVRAINTNGQELIATKNLLLNL